MANFPLFTQGYQNLLKNAGMGNSWAAQPEYKTWTPNSGLWNNYNNYGAKLGTSDNKSPQGGGGGGNPNPSPNPNPQPTDNGQSTLEQILQNEYNARRAAAQSRFNALLDTGKRERDRARQLKDETMGLIGKKRGEFENLYNEGDTSILENFEGIRGSLARSKEEANRKAINTMRAQGIKGSGAVNLIGSMDRDFRASAGQNRRERLANERENQRTYDNRLDQATGWENQAMREYGAAEDRVSDMERQGAFAFGDDEASVASGYAQNLQGILNAIQQMGQLQAGIGGYEANPFGVNTNNVVNTLNGLNLQGNQGQGVNQAANVASPQAMQELLKKYYS